MKNVIREGADSAEAITSRTAATAVSQSRHTPGPWTLETVRTSVGVCHKVGRFPSHGARKETYACVYEDGTANWRLLDRGTLDSELLANARLMAAAPDLLAALKALVDNDEIDLMLGGNPNVTDRAVALARAAIAKAEGH